MNAGRLRFPSPSSRFTGYRVAALCCQWHPAPHTEMILLRTNPHRNKQSRELAKKRVRLDEMSLVKALTPVMLKGRVIP